MMVVAASITHSNCESVAVTLPLMLNRAWKTMNGRIVPVIPIPAVPTHVVRRLLPSSVQCWLPSRWRGPGRSGRRPFTNWPDFANNHGFLLAELRGPGDFLRFSNPASQSVSVPTDLV